MTIRIAACALLLFGCARGHDDEPADACAGACFSANDAGCVGIACDVAACSGGATTSITGAVYDPAGRNPLYDVFVYVPNAPLDAIPDGPTCTTCQASASGSPIVGTLTDAQGRFTLSGVPAGKDIPLVMQLGKFRRRITLPEVTACKANAVGAKDGAGRETMTRLPRAQHEGSPDDNLPLIALTTGECDALECLLWKIGFDTKEFTNAKGSGRIRVYTGNDTPSVVTGATSAQSLWDDASAMAKHDIVMSSCECQPFPRGALAYDAMRSYANGGGRVFGTHYHYNWFDDSSPITEWHSVASWHPAASVPQSPFFIDTSFPKGQAFDTWIHELFAADPPPPGQLVVDNTADDVGAVPSATTRWIYHGDATHYDTTYLSFPTPVGAAQSAQCGRAVFSDLHVASVYDTRYPFPQSCLSPQDTPLTQQEAAIEFLFFDLVSCVTPDDQPPKAPN